MVGLGLYVSSTLQVLHWQLLNQEAMLFSDGAVEGFLDLAAIWIWLPPEFVMSVNALLHPYICLE